MGKHVIAFAVMSLVVLALAELHPWLSVVPMFGGVSLLMGVVWTLQRHDTVSWRYRLIPYALYLIAAGIIVGAYDGNGWLRLFALPCIAVAALAVQQTGAGETDQFRLGEFLQTLLAISCPAAVLLHSQIAGRTGTELWLAAISFMALAMFLGSRIAPKRFIRVAKRRHTLDVLA